MNNTETLKLIDGNFANDDARELLMNLFTSKINFYNVKNLSSYVRFGCDDEMAQQRIVLLNEEKLSIIKVFHQASNLRLGTHYAARRSF